MKSIIFNEIKKILECDFALENPKDKNLAHFATPLAFSLAKELKKSPMLIASDLASKFQNHDCFESVEAVNGYLNFRISKTFLNELANQALTNPNDFTKGEKKQESFLLEPSVPWAKPICAVVMPSPPCSTGSSRKGIPILANCASGRR